MPSFELFERQPQDYKESVFLQGIPVLSIEAMSTFGWSRYAHASVGIDTFGHSAPAKDVFKKVGLVPDVICEKAVKTAEYFKGGCEWKVRRPF